MTRHHPRSGGATRGLPLSEANLRIARLFRRPVETATAREDLDRPLDPDIEVSGDERAHKIVLKAGGEKVSWCSVLDFRQQIGTATVRMAGLGDVATHDDHRFKGYSRRVLWNALRWMRSAGYDVTMLYGIPGFYPRFGYAEAFPAVTHSILVRDAELAPAGRYRFVDFDEGKHLAAILRIYRDNNAGRTGPIVRDPARWAPFRKGSVWGPRPVVRVALDGRGAPAAYYAYDGAQNVEGVILEVGCAGPGVFGPLLREAAAWAWAHRWERFRFLLPEDHAFADYCRQFGMVREMHFRRDGGAMVRMIRVEGALREIGPVLAARLAGAGGGRSGSLTIRTNLDDVRLSWRGGELSVRACVGPARPSGDWVSLPQWALAQLLYGYRDVDSLSAGGTIRGTRGGLAAMARLFPQGPHYHYRIDTF